MSASLELPNEIWIEIFLVAIIRDYPTMRNIGYVSQHWQTLVEVSKARYVKQRSHYVFPYSLHPVLNKLQPRFDDDVAVVPLAESIMKEPAIFPPVQPLHLEELHRGQRQWDSWNMDLPFISVADIVREIDSSWLTCSCCIRRRPVPMKLGFGLKNPCRRTLGHLFVEHTTSPFADSSTTLGGVRRQIFRHQIAMRMVATFKLRKQSWIFEIGNGEEVSEDGPRGS